MLFTISFSIKSKFTELATWAHEKCRIAVNRRKRRRSPTPPCITTAPEAPPPPTNDNPPPRKNRRWSMEDKKKINEIFPDSFKQSYKGRKVPIKLIRERMKSVNLEEGRTHKMVQDYLYTC